jgi:hypothetical protein
MPRPYASDGTSDTLTKSLAVIYVYCMALFVNRCMGEARLAPTPARIISAAFRRPRLGRRRDETA